MSSERWRRLEEVFAGAVGLPPEERAAYLDAACGDDGALHRAADSLLAADRDLEAGPLPDPATPGPDSVPPPGDATPGAARRLGPYVLLGVLGEGGTSTVYRARRADGAFRREVAVKVVRRGFGAGGGEARRRFQQERQILAGLEHPGIARLYDGGVTEAGLPYLVMERVDGLPIDRHCDEHGLGLEARLELFQAVCAAVDHAHRHLVVHRDLKPSNILVTAAGEPRLLDFGIAKLLDPARVGAAPGEPTADWLCLATLHYASPEQLRGEPVTTASDVYSLGVLLYQLLTGSLPRELHGRSLPEVDRLLSAAPPEPPSGRAADPATGRRLAGDLDTIVLQALHLDPERRYGTARELAEDLARHRDGFPVRARPDSAGYRARRFLGRHRAAATAAALFLAVLLAGSTALAVQSSRVAAERDRLRQVLGFVEQVFDVSREGEELTVREAVDRSAVVLERRLRDQPEVEATLRRVIGGLYLDLGAVPRARQQLERAVEVASERYGADSLEAAESRSALGVALALAGEPEAGVAEARRAVDAYRRHLPPDDPALVPPLNRLVETLCFTGDYATAEEPSVAALELALDGDAAVSPLELADAYTHRALLRSRAGETAAAARLYGHSLELLRGELGDEHPEVASVLSNLASTHRRAGDLERAEALFREVVALERRLYRGANANLARTLYNLGSVLREAGRPEEAEAPLGEARDMAREVFGRQHYSVAVTATGLAGALLEQERPGDCAAVLDAGLPAWRRHLGDSPFLAEAEDLRARCRDAA